MKHIAYLILLLGLAGTANAEVSNFVFTTEPQTIVPSATSTTITVQSQNASGQSEPIPETFDLVFTSTSPTGVFLSTSGNPVSTTMSKNTSNKNFLYEDPTEGSYTIAVKATGRTSLATFTATQTIRVSSGSVASSTENSTSATSNASSTNQNSDQNKVIMVVYSAHSSPAPLSELENKIDFEVSGGRDRLTAVGNAVTFTASPTRLQNISERSISYVWSFGDGTTDRGNTVTHAYKFPGDYVVVLNAQGSDKEAVSRVNVKVIAPDILITKVDGGVDVYNRSHYEINMEGWKIIEGSTIFVFPKDTLIPSSKHIVFPDETTHVAGGSVSLANPLGKIVYNIEANGEVLGESTTTQKVSLEDIKSRLGEVRQKLDEIVKVSGSRPSYSSVKLEMTPPTPPVSPMTQTAPMSSTTEWPSSSGKQASPTLWSWSMRRWGYLLRLVR